MVSNRVIIGGMTIDSYDFENDPRGNIGIALADARMRRLGGDFRLLNSPLFQLDAQRKKELEQRRYDALFKLVQGSGIDMRIGRDTGRKRDFLLRAGYTSLKGNGGVDISIENEATDMRIDQSFRVYYRKAYAHASRE